MGNKVSAQLQKKIDFAIKLIKSIPSEDVEVAFSGGKDSSVILKLTQMAGIKHTAIYKNTTIDPPGTVAFCKSQGCEILKPKKSFFELIKERGFPSRFARFCCSELKEYKVKDHVIIGVRKSESKKRAARYSEPQVCRVYGNGGKVKKDRSNVVKHYYPILEWKDSDVEEFVKAYEVPVHKLYYDENERFDVTKRLGCIGCPLASRKKRIAELKAHKGLVKQYVRAGKIWFERSRAKPLKIASYFNDIYEMFFYTLFCDNLEDFRMKTQTMFATLDCKRFLEEYFDVKL